MKKLSLFLLLFAFVFTGCDNDDDKTTYIIDLPTLDAETEYCGDINNPIDSWTQYGYPYYRTLVNDKEGLFSLDCVSVTWTGQPPVGVIEGFSFTNRTNHASGYDAVTKKGVNGSTYILSFFTNPEYANYPNAAIHFRDAVDKSKSKKYNVKGLYLTNSTLAVKDMQEGTEGLTEYPAFSANDYYRIVVYNYDKTRKVECYLGDFRNGKSEIVKDWRWFDLSSLGETEGLKFDLETTAKNQYGITVATYFCIDGITIEEI